MARQGKRRCFRTDYLLLLVSLLVLCFSPNLVSCDTETVANLLRMAGTLEMFVDELPMMPTLKGFQVKDGKTIPANLTIGMYKTKWKFHRDLPSSTVFAFGTSAKKATVPGPTIEAMSGLGTYVKWENHLPSKHIFTIDHTLETANPKSGIPTVVHLHGSLSEPESDGNAYAWYTAGYEEKGRTFQKEVYYYHNARHTGNMWYHDHAMGYTRLNLLAGLIGAYVIRNPAVEDGFQLPSGKYDRHLVIFDRSFTRDGAIYINSTGDNPSIHPEWQPEYFGDAIVVNGKAWPYLKVARRKYRFRIINSSNARFYRFALDNGLNFTQIGSDTFYFEKPVVMKEILLAPSEIADVVIDFSESSTDEIILTNGAVYPFPGGDPVDELNGKVMKFKVSKHKLQGSMSDRSRVPEKLVEVRKLQEKEAVETRNIVMYEYDSETGDPTHLLLNFKTFEDPATETPRQGTTELWNIINLTEDNHPLHVHLAGFQVVRQQELNDTDTLAACMVRWKDVQKCDAWSYAMGEAVGPPANEGGWKNVFKMQPGYITSILVRFSQIDFSPFPFNASAEPGYTYHCHILDHEDNTMMRPFKILP